VTSLKARLEALAAADRTITYGRIAEEMGLRIGVVTAALEELMEQDHAAGRPLLAAVCVSRIHGYLPAEGFFIKALELGIEVGDRPLEIGVYEGDRAAFVISQRAALHALYGGATPTA
jgi:hypothetical protein